MDLKWFELLSSLSEFANSLTFGGMLGGGTAALLYSIYPALSTLPFGAFFLSGVLLGSALHKPIDYAWKLFVSPLANLGQSKIQLLKLDYYRREGLITKKKYLKLAEKIIEKDILGD